MQSCRSRAASRNLLLHLCERGYLFLDVTLFEVQAAVQINLLLELEFLEVGREAALILLVMRRPTLIKTSRLKFKLTILIRN